METTSRWEQRFSNYCKALAKLQEIQTMCVSTLSELEKEGIIQRFEYTHELAWNVMKDYLLYQGLSQITGSRDATREAFKAELITDGTGWMEMINSRNLSSHTYNNTTADTIFNSVLTSYLPLLINFKDEMTTVLLRNKNDLFTQE